jgi:Stage II sporulation protein E (SpoIIE)
VNTFPTIDQRLPAHDTGRRTDPLRPVPAVRGSESALGGVPRPPKTAVLRGRSELPTDEASPSVAAQRQRAQLPTFAPLLEEAELAGWSSHRQILSGSFHDWLLLEDGRVLVMVGRTVGTELCDPLDAALVAQAVWTALRAHARHAGDAGELLSLTARTLWPLPDERQQTAAAVALMDTVGGHLSVAVAGDCLAWRVRAATCDPLGGQQPPLGTNSTFPYRSQESELRLRERLVLVADNPLLRTEKLVASIESDFAHLDAEAHRRMTAPEALGMVRQRLEKCANEDALSAASVAVIRRR